MPLKITNKHGAPEEVFKAVSNDDHVNKGDISVTTLIDAPRIKILKDKFEYEQDVMDMIFMQMGTAFHSMMEENTHKYRDYYFLKIACKILVKLNHKKLAIDVANQTLDLFKDEIVSKDIFVERTLTLPVTVTSSITGKEYTVVVSGTQDFYQRSKKLLKDYKVTGVSQFTSDQLHWIHQQNIYAYMLREQGEEVEEIQICAFFRNWTLMKTKFNKSKDYPDQPIKIINLPVWSQEKCKEYVEKRVRLHVEAKEQNTIPLCTAKERWADDDVFTVYSDESPTRAIKTFYNYKQAKDFIESGDKIMTNPRINFRVSSSFKCDNYCPVAEHCDQKKKRDELIKKQKSNKTK